MKDFRFLVDVPTAAMLIIATLTTGAVLHDEATSRAATAGPPVDPLDPLRGSARLTA